MRRGMQTYVDNGVLDHICNNKSVNDREHDAGIAPGVRQRGAAQERVTYRYKGHG